MTIMAIYAFGLQVYKNILPSNHMRCKYSIRSILMIIENTPLVLCIDGNLLKWKGSEI